MAHQLSMGTVLKRDWPSFGLTVFLSLMWLIAIGSYLGAMIWYRQDAEGRVLAGVLGVVILVATVVCGSVIAWRINLIRGIFARGEIVRGEVVSIGENSEYISHAVIAYQYEGREYRVQNVIEGTAARIALKPTDSVDIVVDPTKPSRAFIASLFLG